MSEVTINGKKYESIEEYMEEINPTIVEPDNIDDWNFTVEDDGTVTLTQYGGTNTEVTIPNHVKGQPVKSVKPSRNLTPGGAYIGKSFWNAKICNQDGYGYNVEQQTIKSILITNGIESLEEYAFAFSYELEKVKIPNSVANIEKSAFYLCQSLQEITIPSSVTIMGSNVFYKIPSITVHVPWKEGEKPEGWADDWAGDNVTIDYAK